EHETVCDARAGDEAERSEDAVDLRSKRAHVREPTLRAPPKRGYHHTRSHCHRDDERQHVAWPVSEVPPTATELEENVEGDERQKAQGEHRPHEARAATEEQEPREPDRERKRKPTIGTERYREPPFVFAGPRHAHAQDRVPRMDNRVQ